MYLMVEKDYEKEEEYNKGLSITELFPVNNVGIVTSRDDFIIDDNKNRLEKRIIDFFELNKEDIQLKYALKENKGWKINEVKKKAYFFDEKYIQKINYRPFDEKYIYYESNFLERSRGEVMKHFLTGKNIGLVIARQCTSDWRYVFITKLIGEFNLTSTAGRFGSGSYFPLYLYPDNSGQQTIDQITEKTPNLDMEIVNQIAKKLDLTFTNEKETTENSFAPIDILDYIYAVLHSPTYREKYKEFLKIDFPRVPYPKDQETFWQLVKLGGELRQIHLLESPVVENFITQYPVDGDNVVDRPIYKNNRVYINKTQYFAHVPQVAWDFYIGGYQPAQKRLKDRKGRQLEFEDILHYQKIIVALSETDRLMKEIDGVEI